MHYEDFEGLKKCRVLVLGGTGMLGHVVVKELYGQGHYVTATIRDNTKFRLVPECSNIVKFNPIKSKGNYMSPKEVGECLKLENFDYVINCIGIIKPHMEKAGIDGIFINAMFPHVLSEALECVNPCFCRLIHITTDCVFDGKLEQYQNYTEESDHTALDVYGKSKSLGEPAFLDHDMTIRTSIIGPEQHSFVSLVEWVRKQQGQTINGFINHWWNGITTKTFASICHQLMSKNSWEEGLFHIASPAAVNKFELVSLIAKKYSVDCNINPVEAPSSCNRTMHSISKPFVVIPSIEQQISEM